MLVLGIDVGGTASRALLTTIDGARVGFGRAGAANPVTVPLSLAVSAVRAASDQALSDVDRSLVGSVVIGMAGSSRLADPTVAEAFGDLGLPVKPRFVGDVVVAFAAGTAAATGTVLISGTGAVACRIVDAEQTRVADGLGWLLGDLGSGFWLGRQAASCSARNLYRRRSTLLTELVTRAVGLTDPDAFVVSVQSPPPHDLARLAPLVTEAALSGDQEALDIIGRAAAHLAATVAEVHVDGPIVLAGGVLRHSAPVHDAVHHRLAARYPGTPIVLGTPGEVGAARLAARWRP